MKIVAMNLFYLSMFNISITAFRILGVVTTPSYSHQIVFYKLWKELSLRGHQVTVLSTHPMNDQTLTNLTEINLHSSYEMYHNTLKVNQLAEESILDLIYEDINLTYYVNDYQLRNQDVQRLIHNESERFDVVLLEYVYPVMLEFSERYNCPLIQMITLDVPSVYYHRIGNPSHPIANPDYMLQLSGELNFFERLTSILYVIICHCLLNFLVVPFQTALAERHFGSGYHHPLALMENTSMMFTNTDLVFYSIRPYMPNILPYGGGIHLQPPKPLPEDLQKLLDSSPKGIIYFSLGSNVRSDRLPERTIKILLDVFADLPYTILWKYEQDLPRKPENVIVSKWFPQQDIFRHPNVKLFITQGGLQSIEEAIYNNIPFVGIPFLWDQPFNVKMMVSKGLGLSVDFMVIEKEPFRNIILEVINNPKYRLKVEELAKMARDQPMTGLERAIWWIEYVVRHKGAAHLKSPAVLQPFYQELYLDVITLSLLISFIFFCVIRQITFKLYEMFI